MTGPGLPPGAVPTVMQVLPALETGGVERGTVDVARALVEAGWRAVVVSSGGAMVRELDRHGAEHIVLELDRKGPLAIQRNADRLAALIRETGSHLVHARSRAPAWSALSAARRAGVPFITTFHSPYGGGVGKRLYNGVMAKGDRVIAISDFIARRVRRLYRVPEEQLVTIHRGVDVGVFDPEAVSAERQIHLAREWRLRDGEPMVLMPGRLTRWKGQAVLIRALARLGRRDIACVVAGDPQGRKRYLHELEALAEKHDVAGIVRFVGHCRDMAAAMMLADVVVSASTEPEGFGRVAAEAHAMGRPVIATDHGGSREIVLEGRTGWLTPPGDERALASALEQALALDGEVRAEVARLARDRVLESFTVARMCAATLDVYRDLLGLERADAA